jgi:phospholipase C
MSSRFLSVIVALTGALALGATGTLSAQAASTKVDAFRSKIDHIVVIYQENWSFDGLYGRFPGADGIAQASAASLTQRAKDGSALLAAPSPTIGGKPDPAFAKADLAALLKPYDAGAFTPAESLTGDLVHRFYTNQLQIDGGKNDKFVAWSDNGGLVMSSYDATNLPEGKLAQQNVLFDRFFMGAFGGSFLNHQFLIAARPPVFPNAPTAMVATPPDAQGLTVADKVVTPDGYVVNTAFTVNTPHPSNADPTTLVPNQTYATIGDRLSEKGLAWAWYSGGWNDAVAGHPDPLFQYHHQAFAFFAKYADGTVGRKEHLKDEAEFLAAAQAGDLPAVAFVKPLGEDNEHPGYASLAQGQQHVADLVAAIQASPAWKNTAIFITYDENGGRWDHAAPPVIDRWGPGSRVPTILITPFEKKGSVDHGTYDTTSILKLIETRWNLAPLTDREAKAGDLLAAFQF